MERLQLNVCLLPEPAVYEAAIKMSQAYADYGETSLVLDGTQLFPHITLYSPEFPRHALEEIKVVLAKIAAETKPLKLELDSIATTITHGISLNYKENEEALQLRDLVIAQLNPLREGVIRDKYTDLAAFSEIERTEITHYGYPVKSKYHFPHITLSHYESKQTAAAALVVVPQTNIPVLSTIPALAIGEMGKHGTVTKIIEIFPLLSI